MCVCMWPLLKLLDLAVLVVLWWCKTRRGAILAVLVVLWGVRWVLVVKSQKRKISEGVKSGAVGVKSQN